MEIHLVIIGTGKFTLQVIKTLPLLNRFQNELNLLKPCLGIYIYSYLALHISVVQ